MEPFEDKKQVRGTLKERKAAGWGCGRGNHNTCKESVAGLTFTIKRRMCGRSAADHHSRRFCLLLRIVMHDAMGEVPKVYSQLKLKVDVDDIKIHIWEDESRSSASCTESGNSDVECLGTDIGNQAEKLDNRNGKQKKVCA